jgi:hypothetical protein
MVKIETMKMMIMDYIPANKIQEPKLIEIIE